MKLISVCLVSLRVVRVGWFYRHCHIFFFFFYLMTTHLFRSDCLKSLKFSACIQWYLLRRFHFHMMNLLRGRLIHLHVLLKLSSWHDHSAKITYRQVFSDVIVRRSHFFYLWVFLRFIFPWFLHKSCGWFLFSCTLFFPCWSNIANLTLHLSQSIRDIFPTQKSSLMYFFGTLFLTFLPHL